MIRSMRRPWLLIVLVLIVAAALPRLATYDRYLPFSDYVDESVYIALADEARGFSDQTALRETYGLLAPLYVTMNIAVQSIYDAINQSPWRLPLDYYGALRLVAVGFGILTTLIIAWTGAQIAGRGAALIGGLVWALSPIVVDLNSLALPDPPLYAVCALAVGSGLAAWRERARPRTAFVWLICALAAGIAALYLKLWPITALLPFGMASLALLSHDRRHWLPRLATLYAIGLLIGLHFVFVLNPLESTNKINDNAGIGLLEAMLSPMRIANNLWHLHYPISGGVSLWITPVLIGGALAYVDLRRRKSGAPHPVLIVILGGYTLAAFIWTGAISNVNIDQAGRMRHIFPTVVAFIPLWASALMLIARWLDARRPSLRAGVVLPVIALAIFTLAAAPGLVDLVRQYGRTHTVVQAMAWFDGSPPRDGTVLMPFNSRASDLWNRIWGAYGGSKPFDYLIEPPADMAALTPAQHLARGVRWVVVGDRALRQGVPPGWETFIGGLLPVRTLTPNGVTSTGETITIYRIEPIDQPADAVFGGALQLVGYDVRLEDGSRAPAALPAGTTLYIRPYWRLLGQLPTQPLSMFIHLYEAEAARAGTPEVLAQVDTEPLHNTGRPPLAWDDPAELYFGNLIALTPPSDLPSGEYVLAFGLYDYTTGARLALPDGTTWHPLPLSVIEQE